MEIFLSYSGPDGEIAERIAARLRRDGHQVFSWTERRGKRFMVEIEKAIKAADAFLVLLSPAFRESYWCRRELEMAIQRDRAIQAADPDADFIHVLHLGGVSHQDAGMLGGHDWLELSDPGQYRDGLDELAGRFPAGQPGGEHGQVPAAAFSTEPILREHGADDPVFRNRDEELRKVLNGLTSTAGPHFWLVVAPPQLGKTWFLEHIGAHDTLSGADPWMVRPLDVRAHPAEVRTDAAALLALMFGNPSGPGDGRVTLRIAQEIIRTGQPQLCLLDSAELLSEQTAGDLRLLIAEICQHLQESRRREPRLALIVASRRAEGWKGVTPLRLADLPLTQFNSAVVHQTLHDLSAETDGPVKRLSEYAVRVHRVTEGLPALLVPYLLWIKAELWLGMDRLGDPELFEELAVPYIREQLLTPESLLPDGQEAAGAPLRALLHCCRVLAPYRFFTMSHVRHHLDCDEEFRTALQAADWTMSDLWAVIGQAALLRRPQAEPWKEVHAAIRRLLFRFFHRTDGERAEAHERARQYVQVWRDDLRGTDLAISLVECLWHEASSLVLRDCPELELKLTEFARMLSRSLQDSAPFSADELREGAADRIRDDDEFGELIGNGDGLLSRLVAVVLRPEEP